MITVHIDRVVHELIVVALARLSRNRPGWKEVCSNAASSIAGAYKFQQLIEIYESEDRAVLESQFSFLEVQNGDNGSGGDSGQGGPSAVAGVGEPYHPCG